MGALDGVVVGITAERRAEEFIGALRRHGAQVWHAPTIRIVGLPGDPELRAATERLLATGVDLVAVTTGAGLRGWLDAAAGWGLGDRLLGLLGEARIFARGPKAVGALRGRGLREEWSAPGESNAELFGHVAACVRAGQRVGVQLHGTPLPEHTASLRAAGADVLEVAPYRWHGPADPAPVQRLITGVLDGSVHALAFTSAPAAANLLTLAGEGGRRDALLAALRGDVVCACVGPVTAAPLAELGVPTSQPERQRLGALVKLLVDELGTGHRHGDQR